MDKQLIFDMILTITNILFLLAICGAFVYVLRLVIKALKKYIS